MWGSSIFRFIRVLHNLGILNKKAKREKIGCVFAYRTNGIRRIPDITQPAMVGVQGMAAL